jgi:hypothetical protein
VTHFLLGFKIYIGLKKPKRGRVNLMNKSDNRYIWEIFGLIVVEELIIFNLHYVLDPFKLSQTGEVAAQEIISFVIFVLINIFIAQISSTT